MRSGSTFPGMTMWRRVLSAFIIWAIKRAPYRQRVVTFDSDFSFSRFEFLWHDEPHDVSWDRELERQERIRIRERRIDSRAWTGTEMRRRNRPPWYRPFNAFLHCWRPTHNGEEFHDHPRWSITICLRGQLIEDTPWSSRLLTPGSVVFRSRKAIHSFRIAKEFCGKTWTIFVVGPRNHRQNRYTITKQ